MRRASLAPSGEVIRTRPAGSNRDPSRSRSAHRVPEWVREYIGLEASASDIQTFEERTDASESGVHIRNYFPEDLADAGERVVGAPQQAADVPGGPNLGPALRVYGAIEVAGGFLLLLLFSYAISWIMALVGLKTTIEVVQNASAQAGATSGPPRSGGLARRGSATGGTTGAAAVGGL